MRIFRDRQGPVNSRTFFALVRDATKMQVNSFAALIRILSLVAATMLQWASISSQNTVSSVSYRTSPKLCNEFLTRT